MFPSAKPTFSSQWLSQDISLFLHEISLSLENSVHKTLVSSIFKEKKIQDDKSKIRSLSIGSAVHNPYSTEDLLTIGPFIRGKIRGVLHKTRLK